MNWLVRYYLAARLALENTVAAEEGQDLAEYGLILALIAIVAIGALTLLGGRISSVLRSVALRL